MILKRAVGERQGILHSQWKGKHSLWVDLHSEPSFPDLQPGSFLSSFVHGYSVAAEKMWHAEGTVALLQSYPYATQVSPPSSSSWVAATVVLSLKSYWTMSAGSEPKSVFSPRKQNRSLFC